MHSFKSFPWHIFNNVDVFVEISQKDPKHGFLVLKVLLRQVEWAMF